jgi:hypothetical protein
MIHTFGDSHCGHMDGVNWRTIDIGIPIETHWIGPKTCAGFGINKLEMLDISKYGVKDGDTVVFSFGEVDCRAHIHKNKNNFGKIIDKITENYLYAIKQNVDQFNDLKVIVMSIPPVARRDELNDNPEFPTLGTDKDRQMYVEYMNDNIRRLCGKFNYLYMDVYFCYMDEGGFLDPKLSDGNVHIKDSKFMKEKLLRLL